jgi:hypothetical protein
VKSGEVVDLKLSVQSGSNVDVYLIDDSQLLTFLLGATTSSNYDSKSTRYASETYVTPGKYALVIENGYSTSVCKVDISVRQATFWEGTGLCIAGMVIVVVIVVVVAVVARSAIKRSRARGRTYGGGPPQYQPSQGYAGPAGAPGYGMPSQPVSPPAVPAYQLQSPASAYEQATPPAAGVQAQAPGYTPAPAPPAYAGPQAPPAYSGAQSHPIYTGAQASPGYPGPQSAQMSAMTQAPSQPPSMPPGPPEAPPMVGTLTCKYCMMQVPAGTPVCPRCGGFM